MMRFFVAVALVTLFGLSQAVVQVASAHTSPRRYQKIEGYYYFIEDDNAPTKPKKKRCTRKRRDVNQEQQRVDTSLPQQPASTPETPAPVLPLEPSVE
jgi:hypothetical protein